MSGKVVSLHQLMEHEALSIETDFTHLKDNNFKRLLDTGESLSSLKTALTRGAKLLLLPVSQNSPRAPMFVMGFNDVEQTEDNRLKVLIHGLKRMPVRRVNPAVNHDYPIDVIKAIDNRLGTASGGLNIGGNAYHDPFADNLHPALPMKPLIKEPVINEPLPKPPKSNISDNFSVAAYGKKVFAKSIVLGKNMSDMRTEEESAKNFGILSLFSPQSVSTDNKQSVNTANDNQVVPLLKRADTRESDRGDWSFSGKATSRFTPYTQLLAVWAKETGGAQYEDFDFPVLKEADTRVKFYYELPNERALKNNNDLDSNQSILKAVHTNDKQDYGDKVKVIQAVVDGDGIRTDLTEELSFHWRPSAGSNDESNSTTQENNDNASTLSEEVNNALWDLKVHPQTKESANDIVEPNLEVIINFPAELKIKAVYLALHTGEDKLCPDCHKNHDCGEKIDFDFIKAREGGMKLKAYVPDPKDSQSGVTISVGFDLGARNKQDLISIGLGSDLIKKLVPYLGYRRKEAEDYLIANPLSISKEQAEKIYLNNKLQATKRLIAKYNTSSNVKFHCIPTQAQTVIASVEYQYGSAKIKTPTFWRQVTNQDWQAAYSNLMYFEDEYGPRRELEAEILREIL